MVCDWLTACGGFVRLLLCCCPQGVYGDFPGPHCVVEGGVERIAEAVASPQVCGRERELVGTRVGSAQGSVVMFCVVGDFRRGGEGGGYGYLL